MKLETNMRSKGGKMKLQAKMQSVVAVLVLALPIIAGAAPIGAFSSNLSPSQTFYGDGAVYGNGFLQAPPVNQSGDKCLQCHQGVPASFDPNTIIPDKRSYLRTGHGNMVKKVTSPPQAWRGALGDLYPTTSAGHPIDWTTGKVDLGGFCDVGGFEGQFLKSTCEATTACTLDASSHPQVYTTSASCNAANGQWKKGRWTAATRLADITFLIGDWMSIDAPDTGITGAGLPPNKFMMADGRQYGTCGSCHNAGYKANDYTRPQPFADYPNYPKSISSGVSGSWVLDGIQCERCHDATKHYSAPFTATVPKGAASTALCSQCHIRPGNWEGSAAMLRDGYVTTINNPNGASQPTAYPIGVSLNADPTKSNFGSHLIGKQVLNSPHGLFSGSFDQIGITNGGLYKSRFKGDDGTQGGCATCHDVHQTTVVKMYPIEYPEDSLLARSGMPAAVSAPPVSIRKECTACHTDKEDLATLRHPNGTGTPQEEGSKVVGEACKSCHMPKPVGGTGLYVHVFRISTNPRYSTFPPLGAATPGICSDPFYATKAECTAGGKSWSQVANSYPDGDYKDAVWVDLDLACGKCHGAGGEAKSLSKWQMAKFAKDIHGASRNPNTAPTAAMTGLTVTGSIVTFKDSSTDVEDPQYRLRVAVNWGDGTIESGQPGGTFKHTYDFTGTFTINHIATDMGGLTGYESVPVVLP
jgi:hypothetical protein